jgi:hypothetical protein
LKEAEKYPITELRISPMLRRREATIGFTVVTVKTRNNHHVDIREEVQNTWKTAGEKKEHSVWIGACKRDRKLTSTHFRKRTRANKRSS